MNGHQMLRKIFSTSQVLQQWGKESSIAWRWTASKRSSSPSNAGLQIGICTYGGSRQRKRYRRWLGLWVDLLTRNAGREHSWGLRPEKPIDLVSARSESPQCSCPFKHISRKSPAAAQDFTWLSKSGGCRNLFLITLQHYTINFSITCCGVFQCITAFRKHLFLIA